MSSRQIRASSTPSNASGAARSPWPSPNAIWPDRQRRRARGALDAALAFLLAPRCAACGDWLLTPSAGPVCEACWRAVRLFIPPLCDVCGAPASQSSRATPGGHGCALCAREPLRWVSRARALGAYEGALRDILHGLKFRRCPTLARPLACWIRERHADLFDRADAVVPVPLHPSRRRRRGFNQAHELAAHLGPPVLPVLRRRRRTETQASLTAAARRTNVESAFATGRGHRWFGWNPVEAKRVVLVDDVWTTGATLMACARVLREAGAAEVRVVAVARTLPFREFSAPGAPGMPG